MFRLINVQVCIFEQTVALRLLHSRDALSERAIHHDVLIVGNRMNPFYRMYPDTVAMEALIHSLDSRLLSKIVVSKRDDSHLP